MNVEQQSQSNFRAWAFSQDIFDLLATTHLGIDGFITHLFWKNPQEEGCIRGVEILYNVKNGVVNARVNTLPLSMHPVAEYF